MHIGVKKPVAEHLGEKDCYAITRQLGNVHALPTQLFHFVDLHAVHALHDHHFGVAIVPEHLWNHDQIKPLHVASQLRCVGRFTQQIQFIVKVFVKLGHHLPGLESLAVGREFLHPPCHHAHEAQVFFDDGKHIGPEHLHRHFSPAVAPVQQGRKMNLCNRGACHGHLLKMAENRIQRLAKRPFYRCHGNRTGERWNPVLQVRQFVSDIGWEQVTSRGQNLPKLHEDRPESLQRFAQSLATRGIQPPSQRNDSGKQPNPGTFEARQHQFVQAVAQHHPNDKYPSQQAAHAADP